ncbi:MAG: T9SS type A sorting domain-containing protein [Bacteroidales bacterium]|nr:T9SS type A sorting domain-containing protein [Bacteroidales bacterium]
MRKIISISVLMVLVSLFAFGQNQKLESIDKLEKLKLEKELLHLNPKLLAEKQSKKLNYKIYSKHIATKKSKKSLLKSELTEKSKLDSTISQKFVDGKYIDDEKTIFYFNAEGKDSLEITYTWDSESKKWSLIGKSEIVIDNYGNVKQYIYFEWNADKGQFIGSSKYVTIYQANGKLVENSSYNWDNENNIWVAYENDIYTYDEKGILKHKEFLDDDQRASKSIFSYNTLGENVVTITYLKMEDNTWIQDSKDSSIFNLETNEKNVITYSWNTENNKWDTLYKHEFKFDSFNNITKETSYLYIEAGEWVIIEKIEYKYDANNLLIEDVTYWYDDDKMEFIGNVKNEYKYEVANNAIQINNYVYDELAKEWIDSYKIIYTLDKTYSVNDLIFPSIFWYEMGLEIEVKMLNLTIFFIDEDTKDWVVDEIYTLYYTEQTPIIITDVENISNNTDITILPNPTDEYISITINGDYSNANFELFNAQGVKVLSLSVNNYQTYSVSDLQTGLYSYNLIVDGKVESGKLMKR